ncbi:ferritin-like domain-containing protein [Methanohalophilus halophilus]|uniref:Rubrerythrin n=1 Tax=Methanohalophilus halophilus TaxID=2177 RepID=A0A1L3PZL8_9EURY|nr:ferritin family protein [Methanohalophilus halophilus]APH38055.1 rubrerythrin family protein [Methanohalophilus halophilus]RNI07278.1 rubrerythrin family protein [Methanohalophilus halophilus]SDW84731.1 Rubrerythrin [Methanohalophilus halophilus]
MSLEKILKDTFKGETTEVGWYFAMSKLAEREGYPEVAVYLRQIAMDEAWHAAETAEILGLIKDTTIENIKMMLEGETMAEGEKGDAAKIARDEGNVQAALFFEKASLDEARHKEGLKGLLKRLEKEC